MAVTKNQVAYEIAGRFSTLSKVVDAYAASFLVWLTTPQLGRVVTNKALTTNVATLTIGAHPYLVGDVVTVAGVDSTFNGTVTLTAVAAGSTISYAVVAANVTSTAATGTVAGPAHTADEVAMAALRSVTANVNAVNGPAKTVLARASKRLASIITAGG
jgi:hypothetical protein